MVNIIKYYMENDERLYFRSFRKEIVNDTIKIYNDYTDVLLLKIYRNFKKYVVLNNFKVNRRWQLYFNLKEYVEVKE